MEERIKKIQRLLVRMMTIRILKPIVLRLLIISFLQREMSNQWPTFY